MTQLISKPIPSSYSHSKSQMISFLLTYVASIYPAGWAMDLVLTAPLYHMPELAVWVLQPLLFVCVTITMHALNKYLPSPGKRGVRGGFMNLCPLWPIIGCSLIWEAEAKPCPCTAPLTCTESSVLGKASGHPGKIIAGSRLPPPATVTCSLATCLVTAKRKKRNQEPGEFFC